jgi:hypothetical protein
MNSVEEIESKGRSIFKCLMDRFNYPVHFTQDKYDLIDAYVTGQTGVYQVEIKHRDQHYKDCNEMLIQKDKFINMRIDQACNNVQSLYVNTFECSNVVKIANITNINLDFIPVVQPSSYDRRYPIVKEIGFIKDYKTICL